MARITIEIDCGPVHCRSCWHADTDITVFNAKWECNLFGPLEEDEGEVLRHPDCLAAEVKEESCTK